MRNKVAHNRFKNLNRWMIAIVTVLIAGTALAPPASAAIRVCSYNILNYNGSGACDTDREPLFRTVFNAIQADIVCVQEVVSTTTGYNNFFNRVLNHINGPGGYVAAPFIDGQGGGGDNALYYRSNRLEILDSLTIPTNPAGGIRDWTYHKLRLIGTTSPEAELHIFIAHLSSGGGASQRAIEANVYRDWAEANLPVGANVLCLGDFNLQNSSELAWTRFTETRASNIGRLADPVNRVGSWHNSSGFADVHTQAPQFSGICSFACGYSGGGVDDRFDFILASDSLLDGASMDYLPGTYAAFGNDAQHFNKSIIDPPTIPEEAMFPGIADALTCGSDHLPVILDLMEPALAPEIDVPFLVNFGQILVGGPGDAIMTVTNAAPPPAPDLEYSFVAPAGFTAPFGTFLEPSGGGGNDHVLTMDTSSSGNMSGTLTINNNSMSSPVKTVILAGSVIDHAVPSTDPNSQILFAPLDFGSHPAGQFTNQTATIHNVNFDPFLSSKLEVFAATILNDPQGRFSVPGFVPTAGITTFADFTVAFDDAGAAAGTHTATLEFSTRDDSVFPGAMDLATVTFDLSATLPGMLLGDMDGNGVVDMPDVPLFVGVLLDPPAATQQDRDTADMNADLANDGNDIAPFVTALLP